MIRSAVVAGAVGLALAGSATTASGALRLAELEQSRGFCAARPTETNIVVPEAVNALGVTLETTAPIAVLDTGVDPNAPELSGRIVSPFDALGNGPDGSDVDGHGTQVAGVAAAAPGLVRGVSPVSPIMPVRIFNGAGHSTDQAAIAGIRWAVDHGAAAINLSGMEPLESASAKTIGDLSRAISEAFNRGVLVVAAAGNEGNQQANIPAALPHVLAVGASESIGGRATFSNAGVWIDLVAPGSGLTAPMPVQFCESGYGLANGTSFSAPSVAAAAAMLARARPELSPQQRFEVLRRSGRDTGLAGRDLETGWGMLDVGAALVGQPPPAEASPEVDDDPFFVRGAFAKTHPTLLARSRRARLAGELSRAKDPADVYPVRVKKGERLVAKAVAKATDSVFELQLWKPSVGDFDVTNDVGKHRIVSTGGFATDPELKMRATRTATYFLSVEAADLIDDTDPDADIPVSEAYALTVSKQKIKTRTPSKKKKRAKKS